MRRRYVTRSLSALAVLFALFVGWLAWLHFSGNFHPVIAGEVYRAAQMDGDDLRRWQARHDIASVLNLRGENSGSDWYDAETAAARDLGIQHLNFRMSAAKELTADEARALMAIMRDAPKPLLIHCMGGADRTGLAAALYVAGIAGGSEDEAEWQLSPRYGHIGLPWISRAYPMDVTWERLEASLGFPDS